MHRLQVRVPGIKCGIIFVVDDRTTGTLPALFAQKFAPHINGVGAEQRPFKDVGPGQGVPAECALDLDDEGRHADQFGEEEGQTQSEGILRCRRHYQDFRSVSLRGSARLEGSTRGGSPRLLSSSSGAATTIDTIQEHNTAPTSVWTTMYGVV